ncbi:MAG: acyl-CoA dehydratase activase-related protein [Atribacterota bacterium]
MRVGIPRGLLFYRFFILWKTFLEELGVEVVASPPSNKAIIQHGLIYGVEEICFPVKVFLGHTYALLGKVDALFIPRIVSFHKREYNCPKILGLPDLVRNIFKVDNVIDDEVNMRDRGIRGWWEGFLQIGRRFTSNERKIAQALHKAEKAHQAYREKLREGYLPENLIDGRPPLSPREKKVVLLGHTYLLSDSYINMNIVRKIHDLGYSVITPDMVPETQTRKALQKLPKASFWTISNEIVGTAFTFLEEQDSKVRGFVHLVSFECGPDSLVGEVVERYIKRSNRSFPYLRLEIDEHTGEAGLVTRLEAFVDMMEWRNAHHAGYIPTSFAP